MTTKSKTAKPAAKSKIDANANKAAADAFCINWTDDERVVLLASLTKTAPKRGAKVSRQELYDAATKAGVSRSDLNVILLKAKGPVISTKAAAARGDTKIAKGADAKQVDKAKVRAENRAAKGETAKPAAKPAKAKPASDDRRAPADYDAIFRMLAKGCTHQDVLDFTGWPRGLNRMRKIAERNDCDLVRVEKNGETIYRAEKRVAARAAAATSVKGKKLVAKGARK